MSRNDLACRVYELGFALDDLVLDLDTHPDCTAGLSLFRTLQEQYEAAVAVYEAEIAPLRPGSCAQGNQWLWADSPTPWEVCV